MTLPANLAEGIAHCTTCQAVCCRLTVILQPEDRVPAHLTAYTPEGLHVMRRGADGWCVALNGTRMNCGIYENRPSVCRRFVMNGPYCRAIRAEYSGPSPVDESLDKPQLFTTATISKLHSAHRPLTTTAGSTPLAKTNYSFEKRQREIAKKKKQDDKQARKMASRDGAKAEPGAREPTGKEG